MSSNLAPDELFEQIARDVFDIPTLKCRGRDSLDFHEVGIAGLRRALQAAYDAGRREQLIDDTLEQIVSR